MEKTKKEKGRDGGMEGGVGNEEERKERNWIYKLFTYQPPTHISSSEKITTGCWAFGPPWRLQEIKSWRELV